MSFLQNLGRSNAVENITLTANSSSATSATFSILDADTISDVIIQNLSAAPCYLLFGVDGVTATANDMYLAANASLSLAATAFVHFSAIRATSTNVTLRITGIGRIRETEGR